MRSVDICLLRTSIALAGAAHLSAEGRQLVRALGHKLRQIEEPNVDRIVTCPAPASVQTAELFAERLDYVGVIEVLPGLAGNVPPQVVAPLLLARGASVVVVAEEPTLSALGAFLIGRPTFPPLEHAQVSLIRDRRPEWLLRPGDLARGLLLVS